MAQNGSIAGLLLGNLNRSTHIDGLIYPLIDVLQLHRVIEQMGAMW